MRSVRKGVSAQVTSYIQKEREGSEVSSPAVGDRPYLLKNTGEWRCRGCAWLQSHRQCLLTQRKHTEYVMRGKAYLALCVIWETCKAEDSAQYSIGEASVLT